MDFVESARDQLAPLITEVIEQLDDQGQILESSFFTLRLVEVNQMREDVDLMNVFMELSTTAFQGFTFSAVQAQHIDKLLAVAEDIAHTLSASTTDTH